MLVVGSHSGSNILQPATIVWKGLFLSTVRLPVVPSSFFVLEIVLIISVSRCFSGDCSSFSNDQILAKNCRCRAKACITICRTCVAAFWCGWDIFSRMNTPGTDFVQACIYRLSSHRLCIETGRWNQPTSTPINERICICCQSLEDEYHFIIEYNHI